MIDHDRARELASLSGDAALDPTDADWLDRHLTECDACRATIAGPVPIPERETAPGRARSRAPRLARIDGQAVREMLRRPALLATVAAVVVALVAGGLAWNATQPTAGNLADASLSSPTAPPAGSPAANPSSGASPSAMPDPWASLDPSSSSEPLAGATAGSSAVLTARGAKGAVVPLDTGFRLASADATPASTLAARLTVKPSLAFSITPEAGDRAVLLTPAQPLEPGAVYRFALAGAGGELLDSWAFQARQPVRVVGTLPDNQATDVPVDTGIEVTFDQDGVVDPASHVSVEPATPGRFEQHGRTLAFIADHPLTAATIYKVTVSRGITVAGIGEASDKETRFQFETAPASEPAAAALTFAFPDQVLESPTAERPIIGMWLFGEDQVPPKTMQIKVYQLANLDAGIDAFRQLRARPDWSRWSSEGLIDTTKLHRVVSVDARVNLYRGSLWVQLPGALPAGWYLVQQTAGTRPIQAVLQVTDVAGYLAISQTRTLVWANDLETGGPIVGATAATDGTRIGQTDARGLATGTTPSGLLSQPSQPCAHPCDPVVTVRTADGRAIFLPAALPQDKLEGSSYSWYSGDPGYWSLLHTDRNRYRPTDMVNIWGVIRDRDSGKVPAAVTLRLTPQAWDDGNVRPAVASMTATPGPMGAFSGSVPLTGLAEGSYTIDLLVGSSVVRTSGISVGPIAKPAYQLSVETGRRVYLVGDRIKITARATFFEGTPVPGVPLRINGLLERSVTTDASGTATYRTTATATADMDGPYETTVNVNPARAEEAEIAGASRAIAIFPSTRTIDASARIAKGKVRVTGSVHLVAVDRLESELASGKAFWELDPRGTPVGGATITARFVELVPVRTAAGTEYDFFEKKVVPTYNVTTVERAAASVQVKTTANGTYSVSIPASRDGHDYQVTVTVADRDGRVARTWTSANASVYSSYDAPTAILGLTDGSVNRSATFGVGERIDLTMSDPDTKQAAGDGSRYLFFTAQRGIREATVQASPRFVTTFGRWAVPNMEVGAVRFTGSGYVGTVQYVAQFRTTDRRLKVDLSVPTARYAPGDTATVNVTTRTASGAPIAATVILRAIDEKLFTIGAAALDDPIGELYLSVSSGIVGTYESHRHPRGDSGGGGGDTTGGGGDDRYDFRDSLLFKTIVTDANGRGSVSFPVSDDLTSWRVTASAITSRLDAGSGSVLVPVGLPFFVDASIAPEYLVADRPSIVVRTFGSAVTAGDAVTIAVSSKSLGFDSGPIRAAAFDTTAVALPALHLGNQTVTITATTGTGATTRIDRLTRTFTVVDTHLTQARTSYVELPAHGSFSGGQGPTTVVVSDASAGRYLALVTDLASGGGARFDRGLAADIAASLLVSRFAASANHDGGTFTASRYQGPDGGLALLPYSSSDLELSALVAIVAPDRIDPIRLASYLRGIQTNPTETRERQLFALGGLAGLGGSVLPAIQTAAADPALTIRERLMVGLGAEALGDAATARSIAAGLIAEHGERRGQQERLRVGASAADITSGTALMAVLTAALGDSRAPLFWAYVEANPAADQLQVLPAVAYVTNVLDRLPVQPASFAYTVGGTSTEVALERGRSFEFSLTASQLGSLTIDRISGSLGVTTSWREPIRSTALQPDPDITISRSVSPAATVIGSADLVTVDLSVMFGPQAAAGCHQVTDLVPSGLTPVGSLAAWVDPDSGEPAPDVGVILPYDQSGARVFFCAEPDSRHPILLLRYFARVVTPGTYAWEPAIAESRSQEGQASLTAAGEIVIR